ncbi:MAG: phosphotransferase [Actinomycetota bacterium]
MTAERDGCIGLDPGWLAEALANDGVAPTGVRFDGFIGTGQMSRNARFSVEWPAEAGAPARPATVVVKVPSAEPATRAASFQHGIYERECEFYRSVAPLVQVTAPTSLAVHVDADASDFAIVLEDLAGSEQGDQFTEPTDRQLQLAIDQAAALQAPVWGAVGGPAFAAYQSDPATRATRNAQAFPLFLAVVTERLGPDLDPDVVAMLDRFAGLVEPWVLAASRPDTLVHGDFRPDNFMFGVAAGAPPLAVVDWQTLGIGPGVIDVAYLLGAAVSPERRRRSEDELLGRYRAALAERGVDYPAEQCRADYALGSAHGVVVAVTATAMADRTERGDALFTLMLNRHGRHVLDVGLLDRLEAEA